MTAPRTRRAAFAISGSLLLAAGLAACGGSSGSKTGSGNQATNCADYSKYGSLKGKTVTIYTGIVTPEDKPHKDSYKPFEDCTGATINYEGDKSFEAQVLV
ncbi:MAG: alpha-glucoside transport system substrate-binding protein, partial [Frankiales bacterium]|nr:alpha-glucoside transport system substrate-binding protein [Frankiales bacterium]